MCLLQVSTGTGIVSYLVHLHIAVPESFILGNGEYHIEQGSTINLVCVIEKVRFRCNYWPENDLFITTFAESKASRVHFLVPQWPHDQLRQLERGYCSDGTRKQDPVASHYQKRTIKRYRQLQVITGGESGWICCQILSLIFKNQSYFSCTTPHAVPASTLVYVSQGTYTYFFLQINYLKDELQNQTVLFSRRPNRGDSEAKSGRRFGRGSLVGLRICIRFHDLDGHSLSSEPPLHLPPRA